MRGTDTCTESLFSLRKLDDFIRKSHPLRSILVMANEALAKMDRLFAGMCDADIWRAGGQASRTVFAKNREQLIKHDAIIEFITKC